MEQQYWKHCYGPQGPPKVGSLRAHINLAVHDLEEVWKVVVKNTKQGKLGYMSSKSPNTMEHGDYEYKWTVTIHFLERDTEKVRARLHELQLLMFEF